MTKKLLSMLLVLAMVLSLLPTAALAEEIKIVDLEEDAEITLIDDDSENRARVFFNCFPEDLNLTVHSVNDTFNTIVEPEENGTYLLYPGNYIYSAAADGYFSKENVEFSVDNVGFLEIDISLEMTIEELASEPLPGGAEIQSTDTPYYNWKQYDAQWKNKYIGTKTIGQVGCAATSVAMLIVQAGLRNENNFDPGVFVDEMKSHNGFGGSNGNDIKWAYASYCASGFECVGMKDLSGSTAQKISQIYDYYQQGYYIVVAVKNYGHYVAVRYATSSEVIMMDPASNNTSLYGYYDSSRSSKVILYKNTNPTSPGTGGSYYSDTYLSAMRQRAEAIVNYTWTPTRDINTWNGNKYNGLTYFPANTQVKGVPYTLFTSEVVSWSLCSLEQYKEKASSNYSATAYCVSTGSTRTGPVYGSCCADIICEIFGGNYMNGSSPRYHNVPAVRDSGYGTSYYEQKMANIQAGDALSNGNHSHIIWVGAITDSTITIYEQTPPVARKVTLNKSSCVDASGYFIYEGSRYSVITRPGAPADNCTCSADYAGTYLCTTSTYPLTIRSGHGTSYSSVGSIPSGAAVTVTMANGSWAHIIYNGVSGYASMEYLRKIDDIHQQDFNPGLLLLNVNVYATCKTVAYDKYPVYTTSELTVRGSETGGANSEAWTGLDDEIYLVGVGTNSSGTAYARINYPGAGGRKYAYVPLYGTLVLNYGIQKEAARTADNNVKGFSDWCGGTESSVYEIYAGDPVYLLAQGDSYSQVMYPVGSNGNYSYWRIVWCTNATYNSLFANSIPSIPTLNVSKPEFTEGENVTLSWTAEANTSYYWIHFYRDGQDADTINKSVGTATSFVLENAPAGSYVVYVCACNSAGSYAGVAESRFIVVKSTPPTRASVWTSKESYLTGEPVTFSMDTDGETNTLWIYYPDGTSKYYENTGSSYELSFSGAGQYGALVETWNGVGSCKSERIDFEVLPLTYTVSYDANGGKDAPEEQTKTHDVPLTLSSQKPTRDYSSAGNYTVTLNANGGSVGTSTLTAARTNIYSFTNWNTKANGSGTSYNPDGQYTENADVTLYAQWNSSTTTAAVTLPTPTRDGFTFKNWNTKADGAGTAYAAGSFTPTGNLTLYAIWETPPVQTDAKIIVGKGIGSANATVNVPISLEKNPGIISMMLRVSYDSSVLTLTGVTDSGKLGTPYHNTDYSLNPYILSWGDDTATTDNTYCGEIAVLHFQIKEGAEEGVYPVTVSYDVSEPDIYNSAFEPVYFNLEQGSVTVRNVLIGDVNGDGKVNGIDRTYLARHIAKWAGYGENDIVYAAADVDANGKVNGIDRTVLARYIAKWPGYGELPYNPAAGQPPVMSNAISANSGATIVGGSAAAKAGEDVDVTIALENNPGLISMLLRVGYDASALQLTGVTDAGVLGTQYHNTDLTLNPYILSWADDTATEDNIYNGVIVTLHFKVLEGAGAGNYPITLSYDEDEPDIYNSKFESVHFDLQAGEIVVKADTPEPPVLSLAGMSTKGIELSWTAVEGASSYMILTEIDGEGGPVRDSETTSFLDEYAAMGLTYTYKVQANVNGAWTEPSNEVTVQFNPFSDVSGKKTIEYVAWAFNNGIVNGTSATTFTPDDPCTRVQFIMMLWKMHGSPVVEGTNPFSDISGKKTTNAILWALDAGVINSGSTFNPNGNISRVQIVMILWKLAGSPEVTGDNPFTDVSGKKTTKAVLWAYQQGITKGTDKTHFAPDADCTRVQLVVFLYKYNGIYQVISNGQDSFLCITDEGTDELIQIVET